MKLQRPLKSCPARSRKMGYLLRNSWKGVCKKLLPNTQIWYSRLGRPTLRQTTLISTMRFCLTYLIHSRRWQALPASLNPTSMKFRKHGLGGKTSTLLITPAKDSQKNIQLFCVGGSNWIAKHHGAEGDSFPRGPSQVGWLLILPMVHQGRAKWGNCG